MQGGVEAKEKMGSPFLLCVGSLYTWGTSQHSHCPGNREDGWGTASPFGELALLNGWGSPR